MMIFVERVRNKIHVKKLAPLPGVQVAYWQECLTSIQKVLGLNSSWILEIFYLSTKTSFNITLASLTMPIHGQSYISQEKYTTWVCMHRSCNFFDFYFILLFRFGF